MRAAWLARAFAEPAARDEAFASTLLHDVGRVVLALAQGSNFRLLAERVQGGESLLDVELEVFGVTHADVGARLLAIWGLPLTIVDVVQFHHDPGSAPESCRALASIVHVADAIVHGANNEMKLDTASLERAGHAHRVEGWLAIAKKAGAEPTA